MFTRLKRIAFAAAVPLLVASLDSAASAKDRFRVVADVEWFKSTKKMDRTGDDEYRITFETTVPGENGSKKRLEINIDNGKAKKTYSFNGKKKLVWESIELDKNDSRNVTLYTKGYEFDQDLNGKNDDMGSKSVTVRDPFKRADDADNDSFVTSQRMVAKHYELKVKLTVTEID